MSGLWTPSGEHVPSTEGTSDPSSAPPDTPPTAEEAALAEEMQRVRAELLSTPVVDIVANHALGLWQLAVLHLTPDAGTEPDLDQAAIAIDAMAGIVDGLGDRLGSNGEPLREALSQLRLAFVQVRERSAGADTPDA